MHLSSDGSLSGQPTLALSLLHNEYHSTILHAVKVGDVEELTALLQTNEDVDEQDEDGLTAAMWAVRTWPYSPALEMLLNKVVQVESASSKS